ncbi:MAG: flagellar hook-length control protein FliK [Nocardioides sp.]
MTPVPSATHQVFAEVERLVTTGPRNQPTQHVTLRLAPEALGEVRVTLSMRGDAVHVRLSAGTDAARLALSEGSPELRRLLEGHGDVKVTVREAVSPPVATAPVTPASPGTLLDPGQRETYHEQYQMSGGPHSDSARRDRGRQARMPADSPDNRAMDGIRGVAISPPPTDQVTPSRERLDVTM